MMNFHQWVLVQEGERPLAPDDAARMKQILDQLDQQINALHAKKDRIIHGMGQKTVWNSTGHGNGYNSIEGPSDDTAYHQNNRKYNVERSRQEIAAMGARMYSLYQQFSKMGSGMQSLPKSVTPAQAAQLVDYLNRDHEDSDYSEPYSYVPRSHAINFRDDGNL